MSVLNDDLGRVLLLERDARFFIGLPLALFVKNGGPTAHGFAVERYC